MKLIKIETGEELVGIIERISSKKLETLKGDKNFIFDWSKEKGKEVYQIRQKDKEEVLGLMSLIDYPLEIRIHINLIESRKNQKGKHKKIGNIPGCLLAYACRASFKKGYGGFVSLAPKTQLISYYEKHGFVKISTQMAIYADKSRILMSKYFGDE